MALKMVKKGGKKVPAFAADGVGKMAEGGAVTTAPTGSLAAGQLKAVGLGAAASLPGLIKAIFTKMGATPKGAGPLAEKLKIVPDPAKAKTTQPTPPVTPAPNTAKTQPARSVITTPTPAKKAVAQPTRQVTPTPKTTMTVKPTVTLKERKMARGGKISEYGGKEMYKSKSAMMKHEGSESMAMERKERKMAMGGKCRGMGAATKGGNYKG